MPGEHQESDSGREPEPDEADQRAFGERRQDRDHAQPRHHEGHRIFEPEPEARP